MKIRKQILWITQTAMLLAVAILSQTYLTTLFGNTPLSQLAVGSVVNFCLVLSTLACGFCSGAAIAVCTPLIPFILGKIVYPQQILIVMAGNLMIVLMFWIFCGKKILGKNGAFNWTAAAVTGSVSKFLVLWVGMTKIFIQFVLKTDSGLPASRLEAMTAMIMMNFTWMQLATAFTGSILAFGVYRVLKPVLLDKIIKTI